MSPRANANTPKKLSEAEFTCKAIKALRVPPYRGIHTVYTGFNREFKNYFGKNPVDATKELVAKGVITSRPVKGGALIYIAGEQPIYDGTKTAGRQPKESPTLTKILG